MTMHYSDLDLSFLREQMQKREEQKLREEQKRASNSAALRKKPLPKKSAPTR